MTLQCYRELDTRYMFLGKNNHCNLFKKNCFLLGLLGYLCRLLKSAQFVCLFFVSNIFLYMYKNGCTTVHTSHFNSTASQTNKYENCETYTLVITSNVKNYLIRQQKFVSFIYFVVCALRFAIPCEKHVIITDHYPINKIISFMILPDISNPTNKTVSSSSDNLSMNLGRINPRDH